MNASYSLASVPLISGARTRCWWIRKKETAREEGKRKGHASDMHQCSLHTGQFIKIIKPGLALKVEPTINLTETQKEGP